MKISVRHYAKTLYEMTKDKNESKTGEIIRGFVSILARNGQLKLKKPIIERFEKIYDEENGILKSEIISKIEIGGSLEIGIKNMLKEKYDNREMFVEKKNDVSVKGGIIIRSGDDILDGSIKRQLSELKKILIG